MHLAAFYAGLLGGDIKQYNDIWYDLYVPGGHRIAFQQAPGHRPAGNQVADVEGDCWELSSARSHWGWLHLDFEVADMAAAEAQALSLGGMPLDLDDQNGERRFRVYADPAGHPFCLCQA
ncbi:VOC family protein [Streptomyces sp. NPDC059893]|uniref:VOC family protein n=1 Tax=Streptomyces sp. NPDC059893 TaxID=3346990 RepID=UPI00364617C2